MSQNQNEISSVVFQAKTQAKHFQLNWAPESSSTESVPLPFLNWLVGVVGERFGPNWIHSWKVCCDLRHAFCGPKDRGEIAAGRLIKLDRDLKRRESSRALNGN